MYQITDAGGHGTVPAFLSKLWSLVEDPNYDHLIRWGENGQSFHVFEQAQFAKEVLPLYFKHSNIASFIRQLNMYGFRKVMNVDQGGLKSDKDDLEFQHPYFLKGEEHLLEHIKRKVHKSPFDMVSVKPIDSMKVNQSDISKVLTDITSLRGKQDNMSVKLDTMKRENEALWREVANLRQKHVKQQQIVNKLIGFLVTLVGGNRRPGLKRKMPLMLADSSQVAAAKSPKISEQITLDDNKNNYTVQSPNSASPLNTGPIIHDVTDFLTVHDLDEDSLPQTGSDRLTIDESIPPDNSDKFLHRSTPTPPIATGPRTQTGNSQTNSSTTPPKLDDINLEQAQSYFPFRPTLPPEHCSEMSNHLEGMQMDINNLKDILGSPTYNFDPSVLLELFDADNQLNPNLQNDVSDNGTNLFPSTSSLETPDLSVGNELVQYTPSLFDLTDDSSDFLSPTPVASHDEFVDLDLMLNTPLPHDMNEYKFPQGGVSADDLD